VAFSPDGDRIASSSTDRTVRVWDATSGVELAVMRGHEDMVKCVAFSPSGDRIASGSEDKTVRIWDAASGAELAVLRGHERTVTSVAFSLRGNHIISRSADGTVREWNCTGKCLEIIDIVRDEQATVALPLLFSFLSNKNDVETTVKRAEDNQAVAFFPVCLANAITHPSGRTWAGVPRYHPSGADTDMYIISLEGDTATNDT
jgi:WD40 repeat protein